MGQDNPGKKMGLLLSWKKRERENSIERAIWIMKDHQRISTS
jgi:hypothetical protein